MFEYALYDNKMQDIEEISNFTGEFITQKV